MLSEINIYCRICRAWLGGRRLDARYCSAKCRKAASRLSRSIKALLVIQQRAEAAKARARIFLEELERQGLYPVAPRVSDEQAERDARPGPVTHTQEDAPTQEQSP